MRKKNSPTRASLQTLKDGTLRLWIGGKKTAFWVPEIFTEGWEKHTLSPKGKETGFDGVVSLPGGVRVGVLHKVTPLRSAFRIRTTLVPLESFRAIHARVVLNLPYKEWQGVPFRLGSKKGLLPKAVSASPRLAEGKGALQLGPSRGFALGLRATALSTVLQDNRQWTPYLHAFVTGREKSDPAWTWRAGEKKVYDLTLTIRKA